MTSREPAAKRKAAQLAANQGAVLAAETRKAKSAGEEDVDEAEDVPNAGNIEKAGKAGKAVESDSKAEEAKKFEKATFRWSDEADVYFISLMKKYGRENCAYKERTALYKKAVLDMEAKYPEFKTRADQPRALAERLSVLTANFKKRVENDKQRKAQGADSMLYSAAITQIDAYIALLVKAEDNRQKQRQDGERLKKEHDDQRRTLESVAMLGMKRREDVVALYEEDDGGDAPSENSNLSRTHGTDPDEVSPLPKRTRPAKKDDLKDAIGVLANALKDNPAEVEVRKLEAEARKEEAEARKEEAVERKQQNAALFDLMRQQSELAREGQAANQKFMLEILREIKKQ